MQFYLFKVADVLGGIVAHQVRFNINDFLRRSKNG